MDISNSILLISAVLVLFIVLIYSTKRGKTNVSYTCDISIVKQHTISLISYWSRKHDQILLKVDGETIFSGITSITQLSGLHKFELDGELLTLRWRWSLFWGDPVFIILESNNQILAQYGSKKVIESLGFSERNDSLVPKSLTQSKILVESSLSEIINEIASEEYPIDNRFGSDSISVEQEISKTVSNELTCEKEQLIKTGISVAVLTVVEGQISADLSRRYHLSIGETITRRHTIRFSVLPKKSVVYKVTWKNRIRNGSYLVSIGNEKLEIPYQSSFGLSYELTSRPGNP